MQEDRLRIQSCCTGDLGYHHHGFDDVYVTGAWKVQVEVNKRAGLVKNDIAWRYSVCLKRT